MSTLDWDSGERSTGFEPASARVRTGAAIAAVALVAIFVAATPFTRVPLETGAMLPPVYTTFACITQLMTAILLYSRAVNSRSLPLAVLASAYLFVSATVLAQMLSFAGAFGSIPHSLQAPAWMWLGRNFAFPAIAFAYLALQRLSIERAASRSRVRRQVWALVVAGVATPMLLALASSALPLPHVLRGETLVSGASIAAAMLAGFNFVVAVCFGIRKKASTTETWLSIALLACSLEMLLAVLGGDRNSVGWTLARFNSCIAATVVLAAMAVELGRAHLSATDAAARLRTVVSGVGDGLLIFTPHDHLRSANEAAQSMFQLAGSDAGITLNELFPAMLPRPGFHVGVSAVRRDGSTFYADVTFGDRSPESPAKIAIVRDVTSRIEEEQSADEARDHAETTSRLKSQFVATVSHELRTPINAIIGMSELMLDSDIDEARRRQYAQMLHDSAQSLMGLVNDLLDFSKIDSGRMELIVEPFAPRELAKAVIDLFSLGAKTRGIELRATISDDVPEVMLGDAGRLRQVFINLLGNALKFTERGYVALEMHVAARFGDEFYVRADVIDTGVGIPSNRLADIFVPFVQADITTARRFGGTGLGLSIVKRLVELMGGNIGVESAIDSGSRFYFTVPLTQAIAGETTAETLDVRIDPLLRVLVVDDNDINRFLISEQLHRFGIVADTADAGGDAVRMAASRQYALIFMDINMPGMDGYEATERIRQMEGEAGHRAAIVALTASADQESRERSFEAGMDDVLVKPVSRQDLRAALEHWAETGVNSEPEAIALPEQLRGGPLELRNLFEFFDGDADAMIAFLADTSIPNLQRFHSELRDAAAARDAARTQRAAHAAKGSSAMIGGTDVHDTMRRIERAVRNGNWEDVESELTVADAALARIDAWIRGLPSRQGFAGPGP